MAGAEQVEGLALQRWSGVVTRLEGGEGGVGGLDLVEADGGQIAQQGVEAVHRKGAGSVLGGGLGQGPGGAGSGGDRAGPGGLGSGLVVVGEQERARGGRAGAR